MHSTLSVLRRALLHAALGSVALAAAVGPRIAWSQNAVVTHNVYLRGDPSTTHPPIRLLRVGDTILMLEPDTTNGFLRVVAQTDTGYSWARNLRLMPSPRAMARAAPPGGRTCSDQHYRWAEKIALGQPGLVPQEATIPDILATWPLPDYTGANQFWCLARADRELGAISVVAWVRRIKKGETDGDWHVELTAAKTGAVPNHCVVAEIPPAALESQYAQARQDLDALVQQAGGHWNPSTGDVTPAVRLRFTGLAFFDGEHRSGATNGAHAHGRCNSSARALWEIHPVEQVSVP
ncbi:MAG: hypothetical protein M3Z54_12955 [Gemmatimonadota bacterium]|nr:hypothetical protein [Gemmatimonadota bacterium]